MVTSEYIRKHISRRPLRQFSDLFDVKHKNYVHQFGAVNMTIKVISNRTYLCYNIKNKKGYTKINARIKQDLYDFITQHTHVVQTTIENYTIKVSIDSTTEKQVVPKLLLEVYVR